ncbi:MAG: hypothetical protein SPL86_04975 [Succiniclasticum sp.]|uniref:hypothetical protein n=1 Tax=Succiniclasticum sp. TaxID=2775030 RepID=UPI002A913E1E|nr:hypothetical protein [Succiniclasticum sp.]MDY6290822.1 hypothetical protein [Succiniclasticum sp.]
MDRKELFSHEFDAFYFKEIHRNPPASLLSSAKPEIKDRTGLFGYIAGTTIFGHDALKFPGKDDIEKELEQALKKRESNFYDYLVAYMDKKGVGDETELYKKAEVNRATYSKIRSMGKTGYHPSKPTVIKLCLALELTADETQEMLHTVGYGMSNSSLVDKIILFFIQHNEFDIFAIDDIILDKTGLRYLIEKL